MDVKFSAKGVPMLQMPSGILFRFMHIDPKEDPDKWKWIHVTGNRTEIMMAVKRKGKKSQEVMGSEVTRDIVTTDLTKLDTRIMPAKVKNKYAKVFKKYSKDGWMHRDNLNNLYKDLLKVDAEVKPILESFYSIVERIETMLVDSKTEEEGVDED